MNRHPILHAAAELFEAVRREPPKVHCLTNSVVQKFTADGLTAIGVHPSMTQSLEEVEEFVAGADALLVNLGTLDPARREAIRVGVAAARTHGVPFALDPVHCDRSTGRLAFARDLSREGPAVLRGNAAEMAAIGDVEAGIVRARTGAADELRHGNRTWSVANGHPMMARVTGTGCLAGALVAAFLARSDDPLLATATALAAFGIAGERAAENANGPGSFAVALLDRLADLSAADILAHGRIDDASR